MTKNHLLNNNITANSFFDKPKTRIFLILNLNKPYRQQQQSAKHRFKKTQTPYYNFIKKRIVCTAPLLKRIKIQYRLHLQGLSPCLRPGIA
jgi:hypothetical protein